MEHPKRETTHKPEDDHGKAEVPYRVIPPDAGWTVCPENAGQYTGDNRPWRE